MRLDSSATSGIRLENVCKTSAGFCENGKRLQTSGTKTSGRLQNVCKRLELKRLNVCKTSARLQTSANVCKRLERLQNKTKNIFFLFLFVFLNEINKKC